jgi:hypothetical protein
VNRLMATLSQGAPAPARPAPVQAPRLLNHGR